MRWLIIFLLIFIGSPVHADNYSRELSKRLNGEVDVLMDQLHEERDTLRYYNLLIKAMDAALKCDSVESVPDKKGRVKCRYRNNNRKRLSPLRPRLIDAGIYYHSLRRNEEAVRCFREYLVSAASPLFQTDSKDLFVGQAAYYAALLSYGMKQYSMADKYADNALEDEEYAADAAEIKACCMREMLVTHNDSARYVIVLLELHDKAPQNSNYWRMLVDYFSSPGHESEFYQFAKDELRKDSTKEATWALYGETLMKQSKWDEAIDAYTKALRINPTFVEACYNLGLCYSAKAQEIAKEQTDSSDDDENAGSRKKADVQDRQEELRKECSQLLEQAQHYLEQTKDLDPEQMTVKWAKPLYHIYSALGQTDKANALKQQESVE